MYVQITLIQIGVLAKQMEYSRSQAVRFIQKDDSGEENREMARGNVRGIICKRKQKKGDVNDQGKVGEDTDADNSEEWFLLSSIFSHRPPNSHKLTHTTPFYHLAESILLSVSALSLSHCSIPFPLFRLRLYRMP